MTIGTDEVSVTLYVESDEEPTTMDLSGRCSGDTALSDYVRRRIQRKLGLRLTQRDRRMILRLTRTGDDCSWTSAVKEFKVCCTILIYFSPLCKI